MSRPLPLSGFRWMSRAELDNVDLTSMTMEQSDGFIYDVDIRYPAALHESHASFPLCPEHLRVTEDMLSPYAMDCRKILNPNTADASKRRKYESVKLCGSFREKKNYIIHYFHLKTCVRLGLEVTKFHRGITFHQAPYLKPYIDKCTELRQKATNAFKKNMWKLAANAGELATFQIQSVHN